MLEARVAPAAAVEQRFEIAGQLAGGVLRRAHHLVDMEVLLEEISQGRVSAGIDVLERSAQLPPNPLAAQRRAALAHAFGRRRADATRAGHECVRTCRDSCVP